MNLIELMAITIGISLDIFAAVECEGAQLAKINKRRLLQACAVAALCQAAAIYFGHLGAQTLNRYDMRDKLSLTEQIFAAATFLLMGIRLLLKAWKNEVIQEHLSLGMGWGKFWHMAAITALYTGLTGVALGFLQTGITKAVVLVACMTATAVAVGTYTGYRFGYEQKTKAYAVGGFLLVISGLDVIIRFVINGS